MPNTDELMRSAMQLLRHNINVHGADLPVFARDNLFAALDQAEAALNEAAPAEPLPANAVPFSELAFGDLFVSRYDYGQLDSDPENATLQMRIPDMEAEYRRDVTYNCVAICLADGTDCQGDDDRPSVDWHRDMEDREIVYKVDNGALRAFARGHVERSLAYMRRDFLRREEDLMKLQEQLGVTGG